MEIRSDTIRNYFIIHAIWNAKFALTQNASMKSFKKELTALGTSGDVSRIPKRTWHITAQPNEY